MNNSQKRVLRKTYREAILYIKKRKSLDETFEDYCYHYAAEIKKFMQGQIQLNIHQFEINDQTENFLYEYTSITDLITFYEHHQLRKKRVLPLFFAFLLIVGLMIFTLLNQ